ncbi:MAG: hypothetical protein HYS26_03720 [Candidatus Kaiserbacteria bacterium]|nr:MAG: hypothetical protein HYS26_03720 [Candidatus Kaiserbacteria bacterium]
MKTLTIVAQECRSEGFMEPWDWRTKFARRVYKRCGLASGYIVYNFLTSLEPADLGRIRTICIGEEAEAAYRRAKRSPVQSRRIDEPKKREQIQIRSDAELREIIARRYAEALAKLPLPERTVSNVAAAAGVTPFVIKTYATSNPLFASQLLDAPPPVTLTLKK